MAGISSLQILIKARDEASGVFGHVSKSADGLKGKLRGLAVAAGGAIAAFASFKALEGAVDTTQELGLAVAKLSRETGLTTEAASHLLFAFKHFGLDASDASRSIGIFAKKLKGISDEETGVTTGGKSMAAILADLGVSATDAAGNIRPIDEILGPLADKFKAMPDGLEKTGLAMQLFGRSGKDMIPILNQGSEGLEELGKTADKLGVTLTGANVEAVKKFTFAHRDMEEAIAGLKLQIGLALMPVLTKMAEWFVAHQPAIRAFAKEGIDKIRSGLEAASPVLKQFSSDVQDLGNWIISHKEAIGGAIVAIGLAFSFATPGGVVLLGIGALIGALELLRADSEGLSEPLLKLKIKILEAEKAIIDTAADTLYWVYVLGTGGLAKVIPGALDNVEKLRQQSRYLQTDIDGARLALDGLSGAIEGTGTQAPIVEHALKNIRDGVASVTDAFVVSTAAVYNFLAAGQTLQAQAAAFQLPANSGVLGAQGGAFQTPAVAPPPPPPPSGGGWGGGGWGQRGATGNTYIQNVHVNGTTESLQGIGAHLN